jgi:PhnB protein
MASINAYLNFDGKTEEAFNFYKSVFGGEFTTFQRFKETPQAGEVSPEEGERVMHVALPIGNTVLMGSDVIEKYGNGTPFKRGDDFSLSIVVESKEEADKLFNGLSEGGKVTMPLADTFWGAYFGMWTDKFGVNWMVNYDKPKE